MEREQGRSRELWETTRYVYVASISPHLKKSANRDPKHLMPLPWDNEHKEQEAQMTKEEWKAYYDKVDAKRN